MLYVGDPMRHLATVGVLCPVYLETWCHASLGLDRVCHGWGSERHSLTCLPGQVPATRWGDQWRWEGWRQILGWRVDGSSSLQTEVTLEDQQFLAGNEWEAGGRLCWCLMGWLSYCPVSWVFPTAFEAGGSGPAQGPRAILCCLLSCPGTYAEVVFALGFSVKLPRPAKSILTWDFVHLTAQMGYFSEPWALPSVGVNSKAQMGSRLDLRLPVALLIQVQVAPAEEQKAEGATACAWPEPKGLGLISRLARSLGSSRHQAAN